MTKEEIEFIDKYIEESVINGYASSVDHYDILFTDGTHRELKEANTVMSDGVVIILHHNGIKVVKEEILSGDTIKKITVYWK